MANAPDLSLRGRFAPMAISPARSGQCRGADSRARRRTCNLYKPPSKWQTLPTCHCEERSDVAISQYYVGYHESSGENVTAFPRLHPKGTSSRFALRAPRRFAPRNDKSGSIAPLNSCHQYCQPAWRSLSAATDAIGRCVFIDTLHELEVPSRDCHVALLLAMTI